MGLEILSSSTEKEYREKILSLSKKLNITLGIRILSLDLVREM